MLTRAGRLSKAPRRSVPSRVLRHICRSSSAKEYVPSDSKSKVASESLIPSYLSQTYTWAYLDPSNVAFLDNPIIVTAILWGNYDRLVKMATAEFSPGQKVLQTACVYGKFSPDLAKTVGPSGSVDIVDVAEVQIKNTQRKLVDYPWANARLCDAANPNDTYDSAISFFLLHEVPDKKKSDVVDALLTSVPKSGSKVVFVDYHRTHKLHPLRPIMWAVWTYLEPFAISLTESEIQHYASKADEFTWTKETYFGGLYQKVIAVRK